MSDWNPFPLPDWLYTVLIFALGWSSGRTWHKSHKRKAVDPPNE